MEVSRRRERPADIRNFSEATLARRKNGDLWMVMRTLPGLHHSTSKDAGRTWSDPVLLREGPHTRACMMRLASGAFLLVYHESNVRSPAQNFPATGSPPGSPTMKAVAGRTSSLWTIKKAFYIPTVSIP